MILPGLVFAAAARYVNPDPSFASVSMLCHFHGPDASTTITDVSPIHRSIITHDDAQTDTAQSKFGNSSLKLDGTGDYISWTSGSSLNFAAGDFTIEFWIRPASTGQTCGLWDQRPDDTNGVYPFINLTSGKLIYNVSSATRITGATTVSVAWHHVALVKLSGTTKLFLDGEKEGSNYTDGNTYLAGVGNFGRAWSLSNEFNGWVDELRATKGVARYTGNSFTPPTVAFSNY